MIYTYACDLELYESLSKNKSLTEYIVDFLLDHFLKFNDKDQVANVPIIFDKCISQQGMDIVTREPIGDLVFYLQKIYFEVKSANSTVTENLESTLESLIKRILNLDVSTLHKVRF